MYLTWRCIVSRYLVDCQQEVYVFYEILDLQLEIRHWPALDFQYIDLVLNFLSVISNFLLSQHPHDLSNRLMYFEAQEPIFKYWISILWYTMKKVTILMMNFISKYVELEIEPVKLIWPFLQLHLESNSHRLSPCTF